MNRLVTGTVTSLLARPAVLRVASSTPGPAVRCLSAMPQISYSSATLEPFVVQTGHAEPLPFPDQGQDCEVCGRKLHACDLCQGGFTVEAFLTLPQR